MPQTLAAGKDADFGIEHNDGPLLVVLLNPERAFVMWMSEQGSTGQHAVEPSADGQDAQEFVLSNGQVDEFSSYDTISREVALEAVAHFIQTREPSHHLKWEVP